MAFEVNQVVRYTRPQDEAERRARFIVREDRESRVLIEYVCNLPIRPTECVPSDEPRFANNPIASKNFGSQKGKARIMSRVITDFEIIDHGIEHSQYFQGCGTAFTSYAHVVTGIGGNFAEAYDDACEMAAQANVNLDMSSADWGAFDKRVLKDIGRRSFPKRPAVTRKHNEECWYHVSIRYNVEPTPLTAAQLATVPDPALTNAELDDIARTMKSFEDFGKGYDANFGENDSNGMA